MQLEEAIRHALGGQATLFVGAGFSATATNESGETLPSGRGLSGILADRLKLPSTPDLDIAADMYQSAFGVPDLIALLKRRYTASRCTDDQQLIASLDWRRIYTTNYDNVIELCRGRLGKVTMPVTLDDEPSRAVTSTPLCVHINGYIDRLDSKTIFHEFKLTRTSYLTEDFRDSKWSFVFRTDIELSRAIIFVGYSVYDLDIGRILYENPLWRQKCVFVTRDVPDPANKHVLSRFGSVETVGVAGTAQSIRIMSANYVRPETPPIYHSFAQDTAPDVVDRRVDDDARYDLLLRGNSRLELISAAFVESNPEPYYVKRHGIQEIFDAISTGRSNFVVHSNLGNGKTLFVEGLIATAPSRGMTCFRLLQERAGVNSEIESIARTPGQRLVIIENYERHLRLIHRLSALRDVGLVIVLTNRTATHDVNFQKLAEHIPEEDTYEIDLNVLSDKEAVELVRLLDTSGLWGGTSRYSRDRKIRIITKTHRGELQSVLLGIVESPEIQRRLQAVVDQIAPGSGALSLITAGLIADTLGFDNSIAFLAELVGVDAVQSGAMRNDQFIREFVSFESARIRVRSSILARVFLTRLEQGDTVLVTLIKMAEKSAALKGTDHTMAEMHRELLKYTNIEQVLPDKNRAENIVTYYEHVKNIGGNISNPYYWLQYAIARLAQRDYEKAERLFDSAYGRAAALPHFDTFHIDNHFARYLLSRALHFDDKAGSFAAFVAANDILQKQVDRTQTHYYPYRVAVLYGNFFEKFFDGWSVAQQDAFVAACRRVLRKISALRGRLRSNRFVTRCRAVLSDIVAAV